MTRTDAPTTIASGSRALKESHILGSSLEAKIEEKGPACGGKKMEWGGNDACLTRKVPGAVYCRIF